MVSLIDMLIKEKRLSQEQWKNIDHHRTVEPKRSVHEVMVDLNIMNEKEIVQMTSRICDVEKIDVTKEDIDPAATKLLPYAYAKQYGVFPVREEDNCLYIATNTPFDLIKLDDLRLITLRRIKALYSSKTQIADFIEEFYDTSDNLHDSLNLAVAKAKSHLKRGCDWERETFDIDDDVADPSSVISLVNGILAAAVKSKASDIHIEPQEKFVQVRFRVDGHLRNMIHIPNGLRGSVAARIKILSDLNISERRKPQDGRTGIIVGRRKIDLRISILPTFYGEKIVMRLLDVKRAQHTLNEVGFEEREMELFMEAIKKPHGMILITGPTGSGKTSTLYSALNVLKQSKDKNIVTIEDPIEYLIDGINQIQVNTTKNVTFANALRSILRQDPDVILVGEIRDRETADIALRSSLTGHLVFSTLHTNTAVSSVNRLMDIGLEPYLIGSSLCLVIAQRLVRVLCPNCKEIGAPDMRLIRKFQHLIQQYEIPVFYKSKGCEECSFTGFAGRTAIFEILKIDDRMKAMITNRASEHHLLFEARRNGLRSLAEAGIAKVAKGITTLEEVLKVAEMSDLEGHHHSPIILDDLSSDSGLRSIEEQRAIEYSPEILSEKE